MSSNRGSSHRKPLCWDLFGVPCHLIGAAAFENPIAGTFLASSVIKSRQRPLKTPMSVPYRGRMLSNWGSYLGKPHCQDFLGVKRHRIEAEAIENPIAGNFLGSTVIESRQRPSKTPFNRTFSGSHVIRLGQLPSKAPLPGLSWGQASSNRSRGHQRKHH